MKQTIFSLKNPIMDGGRKGRERILSLEERRMKFRSMAAITGAVFYILPLFFVAIHAQNVDVPAEVGGVYGATPVNGPPVSVTPSGDDEIDFSEGAEEEEAAAAGWINTNLPTNYGGKWELVSANSGVSAMHVNLLPNNKIIMVDASAFRISQIRLPNGQCIPFRDDRGIVRRDCWSHSVEYDIDTAKTRALKIIGDPWCSSGGLAPDGTFVSTGGWLSGNKTIRYISPCEGCDYREYQAAFARPRWYATQQILPDGGFIVVGGRRSYSFEFVPPEGKSNPRAIRFPFLNQTTDLDENNLYPFVYLSTDGNIFVFANSRSVLLNPKTHQIVKEFPVLPGGSRNYPASGMSALLPIRLRLKNPPVIRAEVIVCGGAKPEAYRLVWKKNSFMPALRDCARLDITKPNAVWRREHMPSRRVMGDMIILPNGDLLLLNGATLGTAAWNFAEGPNLTPTLYSTDKPRGQRFTELEPTQIPRMYHSSSALLPDGRILVGGSNTNPGYIFTSKYPTEMRIEKFSPPYLDPELQKFRPQIELTATKLNYGVEFNVQFQLAVEKLNVENDLKVTMYPPPFTTHGYSMNQRLLILATRDLVKVAAGTYRIPVAAPPSGVIAPPGYYLLFVVYRGVPSVGTWVQIN